jgi:hypothetical protein
MSAEEMDTGGQAPPENGEEPARATERRLFAGLLATRPLPMVNEPPAGSHPGPGQLGDLSEMHDRDRAGREGKDQPSDR